MKVSIKRKIVFKVKIWISNIVLFFLYRGIHIVNKIEPNVCKETKNWKNGYTIKIQTCENGPSLILQKKGNDIIRLKKDENCDLEIVFKSIDSAFLLLTGRLGIAKAYCEHRFLLKGNIMEAMSFVRCVDIVETYLFPKMIAKHLVKEITKIKIPRIVTYMRVLVNY